MKSSIWILNSILALFLIIIFVYIFFSSWEIPSTTSLKHQVVEISEETSKPLDQGFLKTIYQDNDLFGTYVASESMKTPEVELPQPPQPPRPKIAELIPNVQVNFLDPLAINITGIIVSTNESDNQVIIADSGTKQEKLYKTGEKVLDANILRIFANKVVFIRSNGQQETIFINAAEANSQIKDMKDINWEDIIRKESETVYIVDPIKFLEKIPNIAQFVDEVDFKTAISNGVQTGIKVYKMKDQSVGFYLGLRPGDVIIDINDIAPLETADRVKIFNSIKKSKIGSNIKVQLIRAHDKIILEYKLQSIKKASSGAVLEKSFGSDIGSYDDQVKLMKEKYKFNDAAKKVQKKDRQDMLKHGGKKSILTGIPA